MKIKNLWVFLALFALSGCNTMEGMGKDIGAAGRAISGSANSVKTY